MQQFRRGYVTRRPRPDRDTVTPTTIKYAKTRIAVGIVFISVLIYDMVHELLALGPKNTVLIFCSVMEKESPFKPMDLHRQKGIP